MRKTCRDCGAYTDVCTHAQLAESFIREIACNEDALARGDRVCLIELKHGGSTILHASDALLNVYREHLKEELAWKRRRLREEMEHATRACPTCGQVREVQAQIEGQDR